MKKRENVCCFIVMAFIVFCGNNYSSAADPNCSGGIWPADINGDCRVQLDDYGRLANNWLQSGQGRIEVIPDEVYPDPFGTPIIIEAEDCGLSGLAYDDGVGRVWIARNGSTTDLIGSGTLTFPVAIPDGDYILKMRYHQNDGLAGFQRNRFQISNSGSGTFIENSVKSGGNHYWDNFTSGQSSWYTDELAGPNSADGTMSESGWTVVAGSMVGNSITFSAVDANDISIEIWDDTVYSPQHLVIDRFELIPAVVVTTKIHIEAEDCNLGGLAYLPGGSGAVFVAHDGSTTAGQLGEGTLTFPVAIPDGSYILKMGYQQYDGAGVFQRNMCRFFTNGSGSIQENGVADWGSWRYWDNTVTGASLWYADELAGPNSADGTMSDSGWTASLLPNSLALSGIQAGDFSVGIYDQTDYSTVSLRIDYFELEPVQNAAIHIAAKDCNAIGLAYNPPGSNFVYVAHDGVTRSNLAGTATFTINQAIPDGDYTLTMNYRVGNGVGWSRFRYQLLNNGSGSIVENGIVPQGSHHYWDPTVTGTSALYRDELVGPVSAQGTMSDSGWPVLAGYEFGSSLSLSGIQAGDIGILIDDMVAGGDVSLEILGFEFVPLFLAEGDMDKSQLVDFSDLTIFAEQWLKCNDPLDPTCTDVICPIKPAVGLTEYTAYVPSGAVTIDGSLSDWPAFDYTEAAYCVSKWVALDKLFVGTPSLIQDMFMCLMYNDAEDVVYGAVIVEDFDPLYGYTAWDAQDYVEIYMQGDPNNDTPVDPRFTWANGQHFITGLNPDESTTWAKWSDANDFGTHPGEIGDPNLVAVVKRVVDPLDSFHHTVTYEFKVVPYDNYGGIDGTTTVQSALFSGKQFGFDVVLGNYSPFFSTFSMHSANLWLSKFNNVTRYSVVTCE